MDDTPEDAFRSTRLAGDATPSRAGARRLVVLMAGAVALLVAAYAAVGYLLAPGVVERVLVRSAADATGSVLSIGQLRVDPFRLEVVLDDVDIAATESGESLTVRLVEYRVRLRGLFGGRPMLETLTLEQPTLTLAARTSTQALPQSPLPDRLLEMLIESEPFRIDELRINDGEIRMHPPAEGVDHVVVATGISLMVRSLDSDVTTDPAPYMLEIDDAMGARVVLEGALRMRPAATGSPAVEVLPSRGDVQGLRLPVLSGVALIAPVMEVDAFVATLDLQDAVPHAAGRLGVAEASLQERDGGTLALSQLEGALTLHGGTDGNIELHLAGQSAVAGHFSLSTRAATSGPSRSVAVTLHDVGAQPLSLMLEPALDRAIDAGRARIELRSEGDARGNLSTAVLDIVASNLVWANDRQEALNLQETSQTQIDAALLLALLEDQRRNVRLELPFEIADAQPVTASMTQALREFVHMAVAAPAMTLGRSLALAAPLPLYVSFEPGGAALTQADTLALSELVEALAQRPRLGLTVPAHIDPVLDRDALARQQIELHVTLATAGAQFRARARAVDFASPRAQDVLDEFAAERLSASELEAIAAQYEPAGEPAARAPYYRAVFAALVATERIERSALERIGRFRARAIGDALAQMGMAPEKLQIGEDVIAVSSEPGQDGVPVKLQLRVPSPPQQQRRQQPDEPREAESYQPQAGGGISLQQRVIDTLPLARDQPAYRRNQSWQHILPGRSCVEFGGQLSVVIGDEPAQRGEASLQCQAAHAQTHQRNHPEMADQGLHAALSSSAAGSPSAAWKATTSVPGPPCTPNAEPSSARYRCAMFGNLAVNSAAR